MIPEEWPIAAPAADEPAPARSVGGSRLDTVRADFFLDPVQRLTEQERALMTAMLHCLIGEIADDLRAALPSRSPANDDANAALIDALTQARLLDEPSLMAMLLRRADEQRIGNAATARAGRREARALQGLVGHEAGAVSAAAMALILARGRRRDRFGQCLVGFDDLSPDTAALLVFRVAAALRSMTPLAHADLDDASRQLIDRHDPSRGSDALSAMLVELLDSEGALSDELILSAAHEGEVAFIAHIFAHRAGIDGDVAEQELLSGDPNSVIVLMRTAGASRGLAAGILAGIGDLLGMSDPRSAMKLFDGMSDRDVAEARAWMSTAPEYRAALANLGDGRG